MRESSRYGLLLRSERGLPQGGVAQRLLLPLCLWILNTVGCGPALYAVDIASAERAFEEARTESAKTYAPYEYHYAEAHLEKARQEAAEASYEEAIRYAGIAERYSHQARIIASRKRTAAP